MPHNNSLPGNEFNPPWYPHTVSYTDIQGGWFGTGNINEDPMFVLADKNDCL